MYLAQGDVIKHKKFSDVAIQIQNLTLQDNQLLISGIWINQGVNKTYPMNVPVLISIHADNLSDWSKSVKPKATCIRNEEWQEFKEVA